MKLTNDLQDMKKLIGREVTIYIYENADDYNSSSPKVTLESITVLSMSDNSAKLRDEQNNIHWLNLKKCFCIVFKKEDELF